MQPAADDVEVDLVDRRLVVRHDERDVILLRDPADEAVLAGPDERHKIFPADDHAVGLLEHPHRGFANERLGVAQDAVHVKDDGGDGHGVERSIGSDGFADRKLNRE